MLSKSLKACTYILLFIAAIAGNSCKKNQNPDIKPDPVPDTIPYLSPGTYFISPFSYTDKALALTKLALDSGAKIHSINKVEYRNDQKWIITRHDSVYFKITNAFSGLALDLEGWGKYLLQKESTESDQQLWSIQYHKEGGYSITNKASGNTINLPGNSDKDKTWVKHDNVAGISSLWKFTPAQTYKIEKVTVRSETMNKDVPVVVVLPTSYGDGKKYPVVYALHGFGADQNAYIESGAQVRNLVDQYNVIIVTPFGNNSWYLNAIRDPAKWQYETFISAELIKWVDTHYNTIASREGRGITGYSMGGHGAFYNAFKHPDLYAAACSMSGALDIASIEGWDYLLGDRLGGPNSGATKINWTNNSVLHLANNLTPENAPSLLFDCGKEDGFITMNDALSQKLTTMNIKHTYEARPGFHWWPYWNESLTKHFEFMMPKLKQAQ